LLAQVSYQFLGTDSTSNHTQHTVTWTVNDGTQNLSTASVVAIDHAPVANNDAGFDLAGAALSVSAANGVLANDTDQANGRLPEPAVLGSAAKVGVSVAGSFGRLTLNANGSYSYVANGGVAAGSQDSFAYTVSDGLGGTASATLRVTIDNALVTAPLAVLTPS